MLSSVDEVNQHRAQVNSSVVVRQLTAADEAQFIHLLSAVYGDTYSYDILYEPGGFSSLIESKQLTSYGEFDAAGRLLAHTGFWHKEKEGDYVESGCSFRLPATSSDIKVSATQAAWQCEFNHLATQYDFIHQHCSTLHVLAQRYAGQFMNARPCGLILGYAQDEKVKGVSQCSDIMHALMMTTVLSAESIPTQVVYVPHLFQDWLMVIYQNLNLNRSVQAIDVAKQNCSIRLVTIESNPYISLQRRTVLHSPAINEGIALSSKRTDLIHLPLDSQELLASAVPVLFEHGYFPCGLRPHVAQADELIFQRMDNHHQLISSLFDNIKIANKNTKEWIEQWQQRVLQIM